MKGTFNFDHPDAYDNKLMESVLTDIIIPPAPPKPPIPVDTARKIYEDNAEIMKASTCRMNSSDTSSLTRSNANRRRIRWSQGELDMRPRFEGEEEEEEETSTEDEEGSTYSSSSSSS